MKAVIHGVDHETIRRGKPHQPTTRPGIPGTFPGPGCRLHRVGVCWTVS